MYIRVQAVFGLLEQHGCAQRSLQGIIDAYPEIYEQLRSAYEEVEDYTLLCPLRDCAEWQDEYYYFETPQNRCIILEKKDHFDILELCGIVSYLGIPLDEIQEIAEATGI